MTRLKELKNSNTNITKKELGEIIVKALKKGKKRKLPKPKPVPGFESEGADIPPSYIDPDLDFLE